MGRNRADFVATPTNARKVVPQKKAAGTRNRMAFESAHPDRFESPDTSATLQEHEAQHLEQYRAFQRGDDLRAELRKMPRHNFVGGEELWGAHDQQQLVETLLPERHAQTVGAAKDLGSPGAKWEEFHPSRKAAVLNKLQALGVTPESAHRSFSAQVAQAGARGASYGSAPYASGFYFAGGTTNDGEALPQQQLANTARQLRVGYHVVAAAHAILSPQLPFEEYGKTGPKKQYNDDAARHAVATAMSGIPLSAVTSGSLNHLHPNAREPEKMKDAVHTVRQLLAGKSLGEVVPRRGDDVFGPKTGPYAHAWLNPMAEDSHMVVDTHTARGFAPHLTTAQKDKMMGIDGVHAFFDHVGGNVMAEHGLTNIHWTQAAQWGEQRVMSGGMKSKSQASAEQAYRRPQMSPEEVESLSSPVYDNTSAYEKARKLTESAHQRKNKKFEGQYTLFAQTGQSASKDPNAMF